MDFRFSNQQEALEQKCKAFAEQEIAPYVQRIEEDRDFRQGVFRKMAHEGLFSLSVSSDPNAAKDTIAYLLGLKAMAKVDAGMAVMMSVTNMVAEAINAHGTRHLKEKYLKCVREGRCVPLAIAVTEKWAGSDAKTLEMKATLNSTGTHYVIEGDKRFITNGDVAGAILVLARTEPNPDGHDITAFLVDHGTPGLSVFKRESKLGLLSADLVAMRFDRCQIPVEQRLGEEGQGFKIAMNALDTGRTTIAAIALGIAEAAYEAALNYSKERHQFGPAISEHQAIAFKLADMQVKLSAAELMLFKAAWLKDSGHPFTLEASQAKLFCSEISNEIASDALQIHGGYGYTKDYHVEKYFRDARVTTLYEGTSEIMRLIISRAILSADL